MAEEHEDNKQLQQEEQLAVCAIYGDSILQKDSNNSTDEQEVSILTVNADDSDTEHSQLSSPRIIVIRLFFPCTYPSIDMPVFEVQSVYCGPKRIDTVMIQQIEEGFRNQFQPGQVVLFEWIQWLKEFIEDHVDVSLPPQSTTPATAASNEGLQTSFSQLNLSHGDHKYDHQQYHEADVKKRGEVAAPSIFSSEPLIDRKSTFVAHVATVKNTDQVQLVMSTLLENKKIAKATHNIMAYRINLPGDRILQDNDDDGETAAGGRLMHLLQILDVKDVIVVVSRWYGGVLLGADRFKDINNCARKALEECGFVKTEGNSSNEHHSGKKKGKK